MTYRLGTCLVTITNKHFEDLVNNVKGVENVI
jgi:hypothetical protein